MLNTEYTHKSRVINANTSFIFFYYYFITQPHFSTNPGLLFFFSLSLITVPSLSTDKQNNTTLSLSLSLSYSLPRRSPATCSTEINFRTIIRRPVFLAPTRPSHFKIILFGLLEICRENFPENQYKLGGITRNCLNL